MISLLLFSSLRLGLRSWEGVDNTADGNAEVRVAQDFIARVLRQSRPITLTLDAEPVLIFSGDAQTLELVSPLSEYVGVPGLYVLRLALDEGEQSSLRLTRWLLHPDVLEGTAEIPEWTPYDGGSLFALDDAEDRDIAEGVFGTTLLVESVEEFRIDYFGALDDAAPLGPEGELDADWQEDWIERSVPPLAVRIRLTTAERSWPDLQVRLPAFAER
jgi:general secretion pathway protein J